MISHPLAGYVVYALATAFFVAIFNKVMGNSSVTLTWSSITPRPVRDDPNLGG